MDRNIIQCCIDVLHINLEKIFLDANQTVHNLVLEEMALKAMWINPSIFNFCTVLTFASKLGVWTLHEQGFWASNHFDYSSLKHRHSKMGAAPTPNSWRHGDTPLTHWFAQFFFFSYSCRFEPIRAYPSRFGSNSGRNETKSADSLPILAEICGKKKLVGYILYIIS